MPRATAYIALGSNLGDRAAHIQRALDALAQHPAIRLTGRSTTIETAAVVPPGAPAQPPYLNAVVELSTTLPPRELLSNLLAVERSLGRVRAPAQRWAARTIDLDLLLCGDAVIDDAACTIPHPRLHERAFVLRPLAEIAPNALHPTLGRTAAQLLRDLESPPRPAARSGGVARGGARALAILLMASAIPSLYPAPARAHGPSTPAPLPEPVDLPAAIDLLRSAYRSGPTTESLAITASSGDVDSTSEVEVAIDPRVPGVSLVLGPLRVHAIGGEVLALHDGTADRYARLATGADSPDAALRACLPPLPMPQLAAAFSTDPGLADIFPFAGDLAFTSAVRTAEGLLLSARSPDSEALFTIDPSDGRLLALRARIFRSDLTISAQVTRREHVPVAPADLAAQFVGRRQVASIDFLDPSLEDARPGAPLPRMPLFDIECNAWRPDLEDGPLALVFFRSIIPQVRVARAAVGDRLPLHAVVAIEGLEGVALFERIGQSVQLWGAPLHWTLSPRTTLQRFTADAPAAFVLVDADGALRAVIRLDEMMSEREVALAVREALAGLDLLGP